METIMTEIAPEPATRNEITETIFHRRAVRKYHDRPVDRAIIDQLVDAGRMAPSAINRQPYRMILLDDRELIAHFSKAITDKAAGFFSLAHGVKPRDTSDPIFYRAPVVIFLAGPKEDDWAGLDIGMCAQNIMLAAKSLGLDSCPVGLAKLVEQTDAYPELGLGAAEKIYLAVTIGYGNETPPFHGRKKDNAVYLLEKK